MGSGHHLLVVCTANQCRSPLGEFLLRRAAEQHGLDWYVSSAGTHALAGQPMHPNTHRLLVSRRFDIGDWCTTALDSDLLNSADVILTATRQHSSYLAGAQPQISGKVLPLMRFARRIAIGRQCGQDSAQNGALLEMLEVVRNVAVAGVGDADDLPDPVGQPYRKFKSCARLIDTAIDSIFG